MPEANRCQAVTCHDGLHLGAIFAWAARPFLPLKRVFRFINPPVNEPRKPFKEEQKMTTNETNQDKAANLSTYFRELTAGEAIPGVEWSKDGDWIEILNRIGSASRPVEIDEAFFRSFDCIPPRFKQENYFCIAWSRCPLWLLWERDGRYFARQLDWQQTRKFRRLAGIRA
jgi:hypothetical protein